MEGSDLGERFKSSVLAVQSCQLSIEKVSGLELNTSGLNGKTGKESKICGLSSLK